MEHQESVDVPEKMNPYDPASESEFLRSIGMTMLFWYRKDIGIWCDLDLNVPGLPTTAHIG